MVSIGEPLDSRYTLLEIKFQVYSKKIEAQKRFSVHTLVGLIPAMIGRLK